MNTVVLEVTDEIDKMFRDLELMMPGKSREEILEEALILFYKQMVVQNSESKNL